MTNASIFKEHAHVADKGLVASSAPDTERGESRRTLSQGQPRSPLELLLVEAGQRGMVPPTSPKKLASLDGAYLAEIVMMDPERRGRAAEACRRLKVFFVGAWLAECLRPGEGAAGIVENNRRRQAEQVARLRHEQAGVNRTAARAELQRSNTTGPQRAAPTVSANRRAKEAQRSDSAGCKRPPQVHSREHAAWLPPEEPSTPGPRRLPTGDGPRSRPRLGIARAGF